MNKISLRHKKDLKIGLFQVQMLHYLAHVSIGLEVDSSLP